MRAIITTLVVLTVTVSRAFAAEGALVPGNPAGTKQAQIETSGLSYVAGIAAIAAMIAVVAPLGNSAAATTGTTS